MNLHVFAQMLSLFVPLGAVGVNVWPAGFTVPTWLAFNDTRMEVNADDKLICLEKLITEDDRASCINSVCSEEEM